MKKIFMLIVLVFTLLLLSSFNAVYALDWDKSFILTTNGDPNTATVRLKSDTKITFYDFYFAKGVLTVEQNTYYRIYLNGKDAFCMNHDKRYGQQNFYKSDANSVVTNDSIKKIYKYGVRSNRTNFFSQILFWFLYDSKKLGTDTYFNKTELVHDVFLCNTDECKSNLEVFAIVYYAAENGLAISNILKSNNFINSENANVSCHGLQGEVKTACDAFANPNYNIIQKIVYGFKPLMGGTGKLEEYKSKAKQQLTNIYHEVVNDVKLYIYVPEFADANQKVIAPVPDELNKTCTSVYRALMIQYNGKIPDDVADEKLKQFPEYNPQTKSCKNAEDECWEDITELRSYIVPARYGSRKAGLNYVAAHTGTYRAVVGQIYTCGEDKPKCKTLLADMDAGKEIEYKKCDDLYNKVSGVIKNSCKESNGKITYFECEPDNSKKTCNELLPTAKAQGWSCDKLKNSITDSYLVECDETTKKPVSCQPTCEPKITVHEQEATCKSKGKSETFALSDATKLDDTPDKEDCVSNDVGYNKKGTIVGSKDSTLSNSYCDVYCWESLSVILPTDPQPISSSYEKTNSITDAAKAGRLFFWGLDYSQGIFSQMNVKRICWTSPKYDTFTKDWNDNETAIKNKYEEYTKYVAFSQSDEVKTDDRCVFKEGNSESFDVKRKDAPANGCTCNDSNPISPDDMCHCVRGGNPTYGYKYSREVNGVKGETKCFEKAQDNPDGLLDDLYKNKINELKESITNLIKERNNKYNAINSCQEPKKGEKLYRAKPVTNLQRSVYENKMVKLDTGKLVETKNETPDTTKTITYGCEIVGSEFDEAKKGGPCDGVNQFTIKDFRDSEYKWDFEGYYNFYYTKDFRHWVIQPEGKVVQGEKEYNKIENLEALEENGLVYYIGIGFKTKMTTSWGFLHIKVNMANLGTCIDEKCTSFHFDKITKGIKTILDLDETKRKNEEESKGDDLTYDCAVPFANQIDEYECVHYIDNNGEMKPVNKLPDKCEKNISPSKSTIGECKDCDLDIVYRLIDMASGDSNKSEEEIKNDIFPGAEGKGRELGTNWESLYKNGKEKFDYITDNSKIYDSNPIYSIDLTPSVITEIRKDNNDYRKKSMDPYTSYYDTDNKLKILCRDSKDGEVETGANHTCVSSFITKYIQKGIIKGELAQTDKETRRRYIKNYKCYYNTGKLDTACTDQNLVY